MKIPVNLLLIEDNPIDREAFQRMVRKKQLPYELTTVESLREARARLSEARFDIIVADYHLPDGLSTELFDEASETPFILMTATLGEELALRTLQRGADDYLVKDEAQHHLEAVPLTVEKTLHRRHFREIEQRLTSQLRESEERFRAESQRRGLLNEVAAQLLSGEWGDQMVAGIFERIAGAFQVDAFTSYRLSEDGQTLELEACGGLEAEVQRQLQRVNCEQPNCFCGWVARERKPLAIAHVQSVDDPRVQAVKALGLRAYYITPLMVGERLMGTLAFGSRQRESFGVEDQQFFQALASYQAMAKERARLLAELQGHAQNLETMVNERTAKLQETIAERQYLSYSMMHDLRAPLRAMHSFASMLMRDAGARLNEQDKDYLQRIVAASGRMDLLVTDAMNYNRAALQDLQLSRVDAARLLQDILASYPDFQPPRAQVQLEGVIPPVRANEAALTQCFSQLLNNAVKFVAPGTVPRVRVWAETRNVERGSGGAGERGASERGASGPEYAPRSTLHAPTLLVPTVRIWFEDNGLGIPAEGRDRVFDMFQRMHGPQFEGTGIGLALVRKLSERMGGRVGVESEEGQGSRFWLELRAAER